MSEITTGIGYYHYHLQQEIYTVIFPHTDYCINQKYMLLMGEKKLTSSGGSRSLSTMVLTIFGSITSQVWPFRKAWASIGRMSICITWTRCSWASCFDWKRFRKCKTIALFMLGGYSSATWWKNPVILLELQIWESSMKFWERYLNNVKLPQKGVVNPTMEQENRENIEKNIDFRFFMSQIVEEALDKPFALFYLRVWENKRFEMSNFFEYS